MPTNPTELTEEGHYWLRAQRVTRFPRIARDTYFPENGVTRPAAVTETDLPPTDDEAVAELDREALDLHYTSGKWQVTGTREQLERLWPRLIEDVNDGTIWDAKAMTAHGREELPYDTWMAVVYTPNYFDRDDVGRVRTHLYETHDVTHELHYKPDLYTRKGIVDENADEWGLSNASRYQS